MVVALGKFDAMHLGHQALALRASEMGAPWLMSFSGMAEVLGRGRGGGGICPFELLA